MAVGALEATPLPNRSCSRTPEVPQLAERALEAAPLPNQFRSCTLACDAFKWNHHSQALKPHHTSHLQNPPCSPPTEVPTCRHPPEVSPLQVNDLCVMGGQELGFRTDSWTGVGRGKLDWTGARLGWDKAGLGQSWGQGMVGNTLYSQVVV